MIYCGIDPGLNGAIALYDGGTGEILHAFDVPLKKVQGRKPALDYLSLVERFSDLPSPGKSVIEQVGAMPGQGVSSMFRFGEAYGALTMLLAAERGDYFKVTPQKWKKTLKLEGLDKEAVVRRAIDLFGESASRFLKRKKDHNRAEAMLLAYYGYITR